MSELTCFNCKYLEVCPGSPAPSDETPGDNWSVVCMKQQFHPGKGNARFWGDHVFPNRGEYRTMIGKAQSCAKFVERECVLPVVHCEESGVNIEIPLDRVWSIECPGCGDCICSFDAPGHWIEKVDRSRTEFFKMVHADPESHDCCL